MPHYSATSLERLNTCDSRLVEIFTEVIQHYDCSIICGHRGEDDQNEAVRTGRSRLSFPLSKHNQYPAQACDVSPYPIDWDDYERFYYFAGIAIGIACGMGIRLRAGADWDGDGMVHDQSLIDLPHFELVD